MTLWRTARISAPRVTSSARARYLDLAAVAVIVATPVLLLFWLVPLPLVLPALAIASFAIASVAALVAHYSGIDRHAPNVSAWDISAVFTLIWIGAAMMSGTKQLVELFDRLAMIP